MEVNQPTTTESAPDMPVIHGPGFDWDLAFVDVPQVVQLYSRGLDAVVAIILAIVAVVRGLHQDNTRLRQRVAELEHQLHRDSHNSSKPPSSDGIRHRKPKPRRKRSGRKPGAQPGHAGTTLALVDTPDRVIEHRVTQCEHCARDLQAVAPLEVQRRQVVDIPDRPVEVTEHRGEVKRCPDCHRTTHAVFPSGVAAPVQYGPGITARIVYMHCYQLIPVKRISEWFRDEWQLPLSTGPIMRSLREAADRVEPIMETVRLALQRSRHSIHADETGMRVQGTLWWFHVASNDRLTWLFAHRHRGHQAMDAADILPHRPDESNTVHDGLPAYRKYPGTDSLCNAHHCRELEDAKERTQQAWPEALQAVLYEMKDAAEAARQAGAAKVDPELRDRLRARYDALIRQGLEENPEVLPAPGRRRRPKQTKTRNLLERLDRDREATLRFFEDLSVPFTNNLAERDLRMLKVRQNVSGTFRSEEGAKRFALLRGYLQTGRKQKQSLWAVLQSVVRGEPWKPDLGDALSERLDE